MQAGGDLPDGTRLTASHIVEFSRGERYVLFLRNTSWRLSPIVGSYAFRVDATGPELLVARDGGVVQGFSGAGIAISEPVFGQSASNGLVAASRVRATPPGAQSVQEFLSDVDRLVAATGVDVSGPFYGEPPTRQLRHVAVHRAGTD